MSDSGSMDYDDDPVIKEIPVYLSKTLADKLFIFQYPIKPAAEGYDNATFHKTSIKPDNQEVRLEIAIDPGSDNYDHRRGEQIAFNIDGDTDRSAEDTNNYFSSHMMDKIVLQSSRAVPDCSNYSVGIFQDGELHITPLKGVIQMRPQFNYLDMSEKHAKEESKKTDDDEEEEAKQISVTFARQKSEYAKKKREQSFQQQAKKSSEEQWIQTKYQHATSSRAELTRLEMLCPASESSNNLKLSREEYLKLLAPPIKAEQHSKSDIPLHGTSLNYIRTLPLLDQLRIIMKDAKIMSYVQLRSIIAPEHDANSILKCLQQVAVLVQGNWVVKSELIYPKDSVSSHSGISAELMSRARDYILLTFTESTYVDRKAISSIIKLPTEEIKEIFTNLAHHQPKKGWQLIVPANTDFSVRYPDISQRQESLWELKRKNLKEILEPQNQPPQRQRRKSNRESIGSENEERNVGRGRKTLRDSSMSDDGITESTKTKKSHRSRKSSETKLS